MKVALALLFVIAGTLSAQLAELTIEVPAAPPELGDISGHSDAHVASNGDAFLAVWTDRRQIGNTFIYASRLDANGALLDPFGIRLAAGAAIDVVATPRGWLVLADAYEGQSVLALHSDGTLRERHFLGEHKLLHLYGAAMATNGTNALIAGSGGYVRVDLDGRPYESFAVDNHFLPYISAASDGRDYLVVYSKDGNVLARAVPSTGLPSEPVVVAEGTGGEPDVASDGDSYLVVWTYSDLHAQRVDRNGNPNGPRQILREAETNEQLQRPAVAWRGDGYAITFQRFRDVLEAHATESGALLAPPRVIASGIDADVAGAHGTHATVWTQDVAGAVRAGVSRARDRFDATAVLSRGVVAQSGVSIANVRGTIVQAWGEQGTIRMAPLGGAVQQVAALKIPYFMRVEIASHGDVVWVVWQEARSLFVRRYTAALVPLDPKPVEYTMLDSFNSEWALAAGEGSAAIVFRVHDSSGAQHELALLVLNSNGAAIDAKTVAIAPGDDFLQDRDATVVWNGSEYVTAWVHLEDEPWWQFPQPVPQTIYAVRVSRDGMRIDPQPLVIVDSVGTASFGFLRAAAAPDGGVLLAWQDGNESFAAMFRGNANPRVQPLGNFVGEQLRTVAALREGFAIFWTTADVVRVPQTIRAMRVTNDVTIVEQRSTPFEQLLSFDAATIGNSIYIAYVRPVVEPTFEGVSRAFVRHAPAGPRRRVVR